MTFGGAKSREAIQEAVLLEDIRFELDISRITDRLRFTVTAELSNSRIREIVETVRMAAKPKAIV